MALFDYPNYANVGDSAITLGTFEFLESNRNHLVYISSLGAEKGELPILPDDTVILIQGGGNFGDLYPRHQALRHRLLSVYRSHRIIQLPQSIHFDNVSNLEADCNPVNQHPDFRLLVRDKESLELAQGAYRCQTALCPDMALYLSGLPGTIEPRYPLLGLLRTDGEKLAAGEPPPDLRTADWLTEPGWQSRVIKAASSMDRRIHRSRSSSLTVRLHVAVARARVARGVKLLSSAHCIITDRLHAHILCTILNKKHVVLDNRYGKIARFRSAWSTGDERLCKSCATLDDALAIAGAMARDLP